MEMNLFYRVWVLLGLVFGYLKVEGQAFEYIPWYVKSNCKDCDTTYMLNVAAEDSLFIAKKGGKYGVIDFSNKILIPFEYDSISSDISRFDWKNYNKAKYLVKKANKYGFLGADLKIILKPQFDEVSWVNFKGAKSFPSLIIVKMKGSTKVFNLAAMNYASSTCDSVRGSMNQKYKFGPQFPEMRVYYKGQSHLIDSLGKKHFNFTNVIERYSEDGEHAFLEDTLFNKKPVNVCPKLSISEINHLDQREDYAVVRSGSKYFVINKYGESSIGFDKAPDIYDSKNGLILGIKNKSREVTALYDFKGLEVGDMSKYKSAEWLRDMENEIWYYTVTTFENKVGLVNAKGELLLDYVYDKIGNSDGRLVAVKDGEEKELELQKLKPIKKENN